MSGIQRNAGHGETPLRAVLAVTFFGSLGTGVFWNGLSFVAKHGYGFEQWRNLLLAGVMGVVYTAGAFSAGFLARRTSRWLGPRALLGAIVIAQALLCLGPILVEAQWALWLAGIGVSWTSSIIWPIVESYLVSGFHGPRMRWVIGCFNLTWMTAVALPLFVMPAILESHARWTIGALALVNILVLVPLARFAPTPVVHDADQAASHVGPEYARLLACARILLPVSYVLLAAMTPILPYRFEAIGARVETETPATGLWMVVRVGAMVLMWCLPFWHGRWGTLLFGALAMTGGFALVVLAPTLAAMLAGFAIFGIGMGVTYFAALYYALAVGRAEVEAGGTHEGLIGSGYALGPFAALAATVAVGHTALGESLDAGGAIVLTVWLIVAVAGALALRVYVRARRARRAHPRS